MAVSAPHKPKGGRDWAQVTIADDFTRPRDSDQRDDMGHAIPGPIDDSVGCLAYVAITRTRGRLDMDGLSWIEHHSDGNPATGHTPRMPAATATRGRFGTVHGYGRSSRQASSLCLTVAGSVERRRAMPAFLALTTA